MTRILDAYADIVGADVIRHLRQLAEPLQGKMVVHVNSTRHGGGVDEILEKMVPLTRNLGINVHWEVITGDNVNALQRLADIVIQKSTKEGFGLTVTEAMWKGKPVIGGDTGGIRLQVINFQTGFLVNTPEGAALRIRYLFNQPKKTREMGITVKNFVRENFLLTRQLREHLTLMFALQYGSADRIELG